MVFKGYATGTGKKATMKVKDAQLLSWDDVQGNQSFGAILNQDFVDISFDTDELSQKFWDMAEKNNWNCLILENPENGHIHSYWKDTEHRIEKGGKDKKLAVGLIADIHSGSTYIPLRVNGVDRFPPSFEPDNIDEVPDELIPVNTTINLADLQEGDGRNDELFKYILILQSQLMLDREPIRRVLDNINHFIFQDALSEEEMDVITRDVLLRKQTCKDMKKKMVKIRKKVESGNMMNYSEWCSINSYKGWTDYGNCFRLTQKYVEPLIPYATKYYELNVKKGGKVA